MRACSLVKAPPLSLAAERKEKEKEKKKAMKSRYVLLISGLSKHTRSSDIRYECERYGTVMSVERDVRERQALVEFKR